MLSVRYFVEIHELQTKLSVFEARGVANFGIQCTLWSLWFVAVMVVAIMVCGRHGIGPREIIFDALSSSIISILVCMFVLQSVKHRRRIRVLSLFDGIATG